MNGLYPLIWQCAGANTSPESSCCDKRDTIGNTMEHCLKQQLLNPRLKIAKKRLPIIEIAIRELIGSTLFSSRYSQSIHPQAQTSSCTKNYFIEVYCDDFQLCDVSS